MNTAEEALRRIAERNHPCARGLGGKNMNPKRLRLKDGSEIFCSDTHVVHSRDGVLWTCGQDHAW